MSQSQKALYGLVGFPVKHSLSPAMHNAAFAACNIPAEYKLFEVEPNNLEDFLLNRKDVIGFNITIPHKVRAKEILVKYKSRQSNYICLAGAINTVKRDNGNIDFQNTDALGFIRSLKEDLDFDYKNKDILLIGCGGAGRAVIAGLAWQDTADIKKVYVYENNDKVFKSAEKHFSNFSGLKGKLKFINYDRIKQVIGQCQLLVNATPVGMEKGDSSVIDKELLHKDLFVYDLVYNRETELIRNAKVRCESAVSGLGMLLYQGVLAWQFWTGRDAPVEVMRKALGEEIRKRC